MEENRHDILDAVMLQKDAPAVDRMVMHMLAAACVSRGGSAGSGCDTEG